MLSVNFNPSVMKAQNNLSIATTSLSVALERLSTGYKINSAKDDAAGMYVSTGLNTQIRGLSQAQKNAADGISLLNTAEGSLSNMTSMLYRIRDLAVQGSNGVYDSSARTAMQSEADALIDEIFRVKNGTIFNGMSVFGGGSATWSLNSENSAISTFSSDPATETSSTNGVSTLSTDVVPAGYTAIYTAEDLDAVRNNLSGNYILMNDIDLSTWGNWKPIGDIDADENATSFTGVFDGNGHVVKNMTIRHANSPDEIPPDLDPSIVGIEETKKYSYLGLFLSLDNAEVKNLGVENIDIFGFTYIGGLTAGAQNSIISNCYTTGNIETALYTGGISYFTENTTIENCFSSCNIKGFAHPVNNDEGGVYLSGLVTGGTGTIKNCYTTGTMEGNTYCEGLVGDFQGEISNCYTTSKIIETGANPTGNAALAGWVQGTIKDCFYNTDTAGVPDAIFQTGDTTIINVQGLTTAQMANSSNWAGWDSDVWDLSSSPPSLKNMPKGGTNPPNPNPNPDPSSGNIRLQVGANAEENANAIYVDTTFNMDGFAVDFSTADGCRAAIDDIDALIDLISKKVSDFGAIQNRLESVQKSQVTQIENFTAAKSTILDADIAEESAEYVKQQILQRTTATLLTQAQGSQSSAILALIQ